jgi:hypothetical protein
MTDATGRASDLLPKGDSLRRAMQWLDERALADAELDRPQAVSEAAVRFDLTPLEEDFLAREWVLPRR